jgi:hypothetical protein
MGDIKVELLSERAMYDGTFLNTLMKLKMNAGDCDIYDQKALLLKGDHRALVAYQDNVPIGVIAYNQTRGRIDRLCAKSPEAEQKLRVQFAKFKPKIKRWLLGTPTFRSPPGYTSDPNMNFESQVRGEFKLPPSALPPLSLNDDYDEEGELIEAVKPSRSTGRLTKTEKTKSMLGFTAGRRRKTRRRKSKRSRFV